MISVKRAAAITCLFCFGAPLSVNFAEKKRAIYKPKSLVKGKAQPIPTSQRVK